MSVSGGCETAVTARARIGWVTFRECFCFLDNKMQHQNILDGAVTLEETWDGSIMSGVSILKNGLRRLSRISRSTFQFILSRIRHALERDNK